MKSKVLIFVDLPDPHAPPQMFCPFKIMGYPTVACHTFEDKEDARYTHICTCKETK